MNILLAHFRVGETDGVSLEMDKWKWALESLGHNVIYLAGSAGNCDAELIPELHYLDAFNDKITQNSYIKRTDYPSDCALLEAIERQAERIAVKIEQVITKHHIDVMVPNNMLSLGYHLPAAIGLVNAAIATHTRVICHHHDFHWERIKYSQPTSSGVTKLLDNYFPPTHPLIEHCVINHLAQTEMQSRCQLEATVVPNVFDFAGNEWGIDDYNQDLRSRFNIRANDILILQATRVVARKGIEIAIDLVETLMSLRQQLENAPLYNGQIFTKNSRIVLVFAGLCEEPEYMEKLKHKASAQGVELEFINDWVGHSRSNKQGQKIYSLWDVYSHADLITYPSLLEGWGNQFLEGLVAKVPMAVYRYPVFDSDIQQFQFNIIDLGNDHQLDSNGLAVIKTERLLSAAHACLEYLIDGEKRRDRMEQNYAIGQHHFSYNALKSKLNGIFSNAL
ncbi:glycosyltransferase family 4 protein [Vibrio ulleungensis]|uniref:Glycosyltransferase family 4 protein n=1 Tax=Vibrio ulleungensis TaxID=2807619 RepID=A0ABS2HB66_9VIBR|nr:glycosyltransferase family 4 protein [Vibrio ulleungensis]MBM7034843.1 glycosyltransferase family 4 protein [Vibrio ulleungensis]